MQVGEAGGPEPQGAVEAGELERAAEVDPGVTERVDVGQRGIQKDAREPAPKQFPQ